MLGVLIVELAEALELGLEQVLELELELELTRAPRSYQSRHHLHQSTWPTLSEKHHQRDAMAKPEHVVVELEGEAAVSLWWWRSQTGATLPGWAALSWLPSPPLPPTMYSRGQSTRKMVQLLPLPEGRKWPLFVIFNANLSIKKGSQEGYNWQHSGVTCEQSADILVKRSKQHTHTCPQQSTL